MRSLGKAILATLALLFAPPALAQQTAAPSAALPKAPVPYSQIRPKAAPPASTPAAATPRPAAPQRVVSGAKLPIGQPIDQAALQSAGLARGGKDGVRLLGKGTFSAAATFRVAGVSKGARAAVEAATRVLQRAHALALVRRAEEVPRAVAEHADRFVFAVIAHR